MRSKKVEAVCSANIIRSQMLAAYLSRWFGEGKLSCYDSVLSSGVNVGCEVSPATLRSSYATLTEQVLAEAGLPYFHERRKFVRQDGVLYLPVDGKVQGVLRGEGVETFSLVDITGEEILDPRFGAIGGYRAYRDMIARNEKRIIAHLMEDG